VFLNPALLSIFYMSDFSFALLVQEYTLDGSTPPVRTQVGNPYTFPLNQGGGFLGGGSDDYSTYANFFSITPVPVIGKHELDCFARAFSNDFDGSPITTQTVSAPYTGLMLALADLLQSSLAVRICQASCELVPC
jgi:hypothetical protein